MTIEAFMIIVGFGSMALICLYIVILALAMIIGEYVE